MNEGIERIVQLERTVERMQRRERLVVVIAMIVLAAAVAAIGMPRAVAKPPGGEVRDTLRVRQLSIIDANGVERVRIGAPVPEPIVLGKRSRRDGAMSGIILYDAEGTERSGYCTGDDYPNVLFTLDSMSKQHVLFMAEPQGSPSLSLFAKRGAVRMWVDEDGVPAVKLIKGGQDILELPVPATSTQK
jgi:hypothetical protein